MGKQVVYIAVGLIVILLSTPLAYTSMNVVYQNKNLTGEYVPILNGFIHSFMLIGTLIFSLGLISIAKRKNPNL